MKQAHVYMEIQFTRVVFQIKNGLFHMQITVTTGCFLEKTKVKSLLHIIPQNDLQTGQSTKCKKGKKTVMVFGETVEIYFQNLGYKSHLQGFPGGAVVESLPANAGDTGSSPGLGRSHMPRSDWAREPQLLSLRVWCLCSATREAAIVRGPRTAMKNGPRLPQLEKALAQKRRPNTAKNK